MVAPRWVLGPVGSAQLLRPNAAIADIARIDSFFILFSRVSSIIVKFPEVSRTFESLYRARLTYYRRSVHR